MEYEEKIKMEMKGEMNIEIRNFVDINENMKEKKYREWKRDGWGE